MSVRKAAIVLAMVAASLLAVPMAAGAATTAPTTQATSLKTVPVTGKAKNGKAFTGRYTISQFVTRGGKSFAVGTLTGRLGHRSIKPKQVSMPVAVPQGSSTGLLGGAAAACPILHLDLGPLNLNLLGLQVHLNEVVLDITAQSGPGNLLGNLLCGVSNLLNGNSVVGQELTSLLNIVTQLTNTPGLLNL
ncbi:MAG: hypothetical protein WAK93_21555 [Solirubrobacteraceae bacterium]